MPCLATALFVSFYLVAWQISFLGRISLRSVHNMEQANILVEILRLIEGFLQKVTCFSYFTSSECITKIDFVNLVFPMQLSLPADVVKLTFSCEELLKTEVNESAVLGHLSQLVEDIKLLQVMKLLF